jgi:hypothetical protein
MGLRTKMAPFLITITTVLLALFGLLAVHELGQSLEGSPPANAAGEVRPAAPRARPVPPTAPAPRAWPASAAKLARPHIALILADDFGWANLGRHMRENTGESSDKYGVHTPRLDSLIERGVLLDRHYSYRICSPSRSSLQTGRLAVRAGAIVRVTPRPRAIAPSRIHQTAQGLHIPHGLPGARRNAAGARKHVQHQSDRAQPSRSGERILGHPCQHDRHRDQAQAGWMCALRALRAWLPGSLRRRASA